VKFVTSFRYTKVKSNEYCKTVSMMLAFMLNKCSPHVSTKLSLASLSTDLAHLSVCPTLPKCRVIGLV